MDETRTVGQVRQWSTERLRRFLRECDTPCELCSPYPLLEAARIELARRRGGGALDWRCRVSGPDGDARTMTVALPVGLAPAQLHAAALVQARRRHGPRVQVQVLAVDDGHGAPEHPAAPAAGARTPVCRGGGRVPRCGCRRPAGPAIGEARE